MRPSFSIIFFTVASGAGYGLWILAALVILSAWPHNTAEFAANFTPAEQVTGPAGLIMSLLAVGFILVSSGLLSSLGHLGQPQRAWRALSQWRSSWLSREGIAALATFIPASIIVVALVPSVLALHAVGPMVAEACLPTAFSAHIYTSSVLLAIGAVATVFCTANIYACLKPVRAWHNHYVVVGYLLLGIYTGGLFAWALSALQGGSIQDLRFLLIYVTVAAVAAALLKFLYWRHIDADTSGSTANAIGLSSLGNVRSFEQPHTEENYLTHEMGFRVARRHSRKLRMICLTAGFAIPAMLAAISLYWPVAGRIVAWLALFSGMLGIFVERWLFFAEAKHTVMLYYR
jgi:sulfite dehydrogenase (quinone) subunit SoeC